jgi:hypothetical protein
LKDDETDIRIFQYVFRVIRALVRPHTGLAQDRQVLMRVAWRVTRMLLARRSGDGLFADTQRHEDTQTIQTIQTLVANHHR